MNLNLEKDSIREKKDMTPKFEQRIISQGPFCLLQEVTTWRKPVWTVSWGVCKVIHLNSLEELAWSCKTMIYLNGRFDKHIESRVNLFRKCQSYSRSYGSKCAMIMISHFSCIQPFVTPWTVACQAPLSMGILQARMLEWAAMPSSRGSSQPRDGTWVSCTAGGLFTSWATREALVWGQT